MCVHFDIFLYPAGDDEMDKYVSGSSFRIWLFVSCLCLFSRFALSQDMLIQKNINVFQAHLFSNLHHTIPATWAPLASTSNRNVYATFSMLVNPFADQYVGDDVGIPSNCVPIDTSGFDVILSENKF